MTNVWHHDPTIDLDVAAIFDPFGNAVHTALSVRRARRGRADHRRRADRLMAAAVAQHAGARHVVVTDVNPYRLELARKMGVDAWRSTSATTLDRGRAAASSA